MISNSIRFRVKDIVRGVRYLLLAAFLLNWNVSALKADPVRLSEDEAKKNLVTKVAPVYPPMARQLNLSGRVVIDLNVAEDGSIEKVDIISGNPILGGAAANAGKKWKFQPFTSDGKPAKAIVRINVEFSR